MRISLVHALACATALVCGWAGNASAADVQFVNYQAMQQVITQQNQQLTQQNERLGQLEARLASFAEGEAAPSAGWNNGSCNGESCNGEGCDNCCSGSRGVTWDVELLFLRLYDDTSFVLDNYQAAYRISAGWQGCEDLGFRIRYFDFENEELAADTRFDTFSLDLEATSKFCVCNWRGVFSFGARYAELFVLDDDSIDQDVFFSIGPVVGIELRRDIRCDTNLFILARESLQFGKDFNDGGRPDGDPTGWAITELQIGAEWRRERCCGGTFFARAAWEGQYFHEDNVDEETHGLMGGAFAIGLSR